MVTRSNGKDMSCEVVALTRIQLVGLGVCPTMSEMGISRTLSRHRVLRFDSDRPSWLGQDDQPLGEALNFLRAFRESRELIVREMHLQPLLNSLHQHASEWAWLGVPPPWGAIAPLPITAPP